MAIWSNGARRGGVLAFQSLENQLLLDAAAGADMPAGLPLRLAAGDEVCCDDVLAAGDKGCCDDGCCEDARVAAGELRGLPPPDCWEARTRWMSLRISWCT